MAVATTMGGGWASVRNAEKALEWALRLMDLAAKIGDAATVRKCCVFVGWALLWRGGGRCSRAVFTVQQEAAASAEDSVNYRRCMAALLHHDYALQNAPGTVPRVHTAQSLVECQRDDAENLETVWAHAFAIATHASSEI
jgi:hypothetical protein